MNIPGLYARILMAHFIIIDFKNGCQNKLKDTSTIVADRHSSATKNTTSAIYSSRLLFTRPTVFIARKDRIQLNIRHIAATPVTLSIIVASPNFATLIDVITIRQKPNKLADVFKMCGDLLLLSI